MVQVSTMLAAMGCLFSSSFLLVSSSPLSTMEKAMADDGYTLGQIQWRGALEEGKPLVYLTGDNFDDIEEQAKALNPTYTIFAEQNATAEVEARDLQTRQTESINCGWPPSWGPALNTWALWDGVAYLQRITGDCRADPGHGWCGRVSCSWSSGIYFCNDNTREHWEPCRWIGDVAGAIIQKCNNHGQAFDRRNWNTIVARGDC